MTDHDILPIVCMADGCDAALIVTPLTYPSVATTGHPGQKVIDERAPRRQHARCEGTPQHRFERHEGFDWRPVP